MGSSPVWPTAIKADRAHYLTDIALNIAVLAALGVTRLTGWERADPTFALAISSYMILNSYNISVDVMEQLLDRELPQADRERIERSCWLVKASAASMIFGRAMLATGGSSNSILRSMAKRRWKKTNRSPPQARANILSFL